MDPQKSGIQQMKETKQNQKTTKREETKEVLIPVE